MSNEFKRIFDNNSGDRYRYRYRNRPTLIVQLPVLVSTSQWIPAKKTLKTAGGVNNQLLYLVPTFKIENRSNFLTSAAEFLHWSQNVIKLGFPGNFITNECSVQSSCAREKISSKKAIIFAVLYERYIGRTNYYSEKLLVFFTLISIRGDTS
jgi:hypothetical protein